MAGLLQHTGTAAEPGSSMRPEEEDAIEQEWDKLGGCPDFWLLTRYLHNYFQGTAHAFAKMPSVALRSAERSQVEPQQHAAQAPGTAKEAPARSSLDAATNSRVSGDTASSSMQQVQRGGSIGMTTLGLKPGRHAAARQGPAPGSALCGSPLKSMLAPCHGTEVNDHLYGYGEHTDSLGAAGDQGLGPAAERA